LFHLIGGGGGHELLIEQLEIIIKMKEGTVKAQTEYTDVKCENGHECVRFDGSHPTYEAGYAICEYSKDQESCLKDAFKGYHCSICQFDLCQNCANRIYG
jgi:hypothetical protein